LLLLFLQVLKVVAAAVEGALAGQKKQDKLKGRINHEFNKVRRCMVHAALLMHSISGILCISMPD
jgi:hypothetical protein